jgi:ABC-type multidrug transport system permease subunit
MKALVGQAQAEFRLTLRDKTVLLFSLFFPVITVAFFGYLNRGGQVGEVSYASFLIAGGIGMVVSSAAFQNLCAALARQRDIGILKRLGGTPLRVRTLVGAKVLIAAVVILAQTLIMVVLNVWLFKAELGGNLFWTLVVLTLGVVTSPRWVLPWQGCAAMPTLPPQPAWPSPCRCSSYAAPSSPWRGCHRSFGTWPRYCR